MYKISTSHDFDAPAAILWDYLQDFAHIERWWPTHDPAVELERVELEGEGIGMVRHMYNKGYADAISERLDAIDPENLSYRLSMVGKKPMGVTHYHAFGRVEALPGNRSRLHYASEFMTESGKPDEAETWLRMAYQLMFAGLAAAVSRRT